jgi:hypothetical protein
VGSEAMLLFSAKPHKFNFNSNYQVIIIEIFVKVKSNTQKIMSLDEDITKEEASKSLLPQKYRNLRFQKTRVFWTKKQSKAF